MTEKHLTTADDIIDALKNANNFDEARAALDHVATLPQAEKQSFADRLSSGDLTKEFIHAAQKPRTSPFQLMFIEPLNDVTTAKKPEFRIIAKSPPPKN